MDQAKLARMATIGAVVFILIAFLSNSTFLTINPGEKGVLFKKFSGGLEKDKIYGQGFHVVAPWNSMIVYDIREQKKEETMDVLSLDGLTIAIDVSTRFHPEPTKIGYLHDEIGTNFAEKIVTDVIRASAREVIGKYTPEELYSSKRDEVRKGIEDIVREKLLEKYITLQAVNLRSIKLPEKIKEAIETKLEQKQQQEQYKYRLLKEEKEAERKRIEAQGIKDFQEIVSQGINENYLRWKGIEATNELSQSENAKVVIIGSGKDGMPLILGQ